jgi:hypothetical protein
VINAEDAMARLDRFALELNRPESRGILAQYYRHSELRRSYSPTVI